MLSLPTVHHCDVARLKAGKRGLVHDEGCCRAPTHIVHDEGCCRAPTHIVHEPKVGVGSVVDHQLSAHLGRDYAAVGQTVGTTLCQLDDGVVQTVS